MAEVRIAELIFDATLYPRHEVDSHHVRELADAIRAGATMPPIIADRVSKRIVDGVHRCNAVRRVHGDEAKAAVEWRKYKNDGELFVDAARLNAGHGRRYSPFDIVRIRHVAEGLEIDPAYLAANLSMTVERLGKLEITKTAIGPTGGLQPIRRAVSHMAGQQLTETQAKGAERMGGMSLLYYANQIMTAVEHDLLPVDNVRLMDRLVELVEALRPVLRARKRAA